MRTAIVFLLFFSILPLALSQAWIAPLVYVGFSVMNPHKLTYGSALFFPFAQVAALVSLFMLVITKDRRALPNHALVYLIGALYLWMGVTSMTTINPEERVWTQWIEVSKTYLMITVLVLLVYERKSIQMYILVIVASIAFYGFKGGLFTILTGGSDRVWGAPGSVIEGNNEIGLGIVMIMPLLTYYYRSSKTLYGRLGIAFVFLLCSVAVLGTQSRGAAVALMAMTFFLATRSKHPFVATIGLILMGILAFSLMPDSWTDRMMTLRNHEADGSAMSRISTWQMILTMAGDRPIVGSGFALDHVGNYVKYHANFSPGDIPIAAHSIYFQALGEHGYVGLILYLAILASTWRTLGVLSKRFGAIEGEEWAGDLCRMVQIALVGFCSGGAFLGLMHWDVPLYLVTLCIILVRYARNFEVTDSVVAPSGDRIGMRYSRNSGYN